MIDAAKRLTKEGQKKMIDEKNGLERSLELEIELEIEELEARAVPDSAVAVLD